MSNLMLYRLPILILTTGIVYIFISPSEPLAFSIFFKVIPMVLILIYAFEQSLPKRKAVHYWIIGGIIFCLIGDATLHWFLIGLTAFFCWSCILYNRLFKRMALFFTKISFFYTTYSFCLLDWLSAYKQTAD